MNKWIKFAIASVLWVLVFVVWMRCLWMLPGLAIIWDIYISKFFERHILERHRTLQQKNRAYHDVTEWVWAVVYAVVIATLIHTFVFQMYVIPTPSMEKTLLVGDYLYVSKLTYGPRVMNTPLAVPLVHNRFMGGKSYSTAVQWKYKRLRGLKKMRRDDVVVFNWPADTLFGHPVDKRENYVKRLIALPGDTVDVRNLQVYVNGEAQEALPGSQRNYMVVTDAPLSDTALDGMGMSADDILYHNPSTGEYILPLTVANAKRVKTMGNVALVQEYDRGPDPMIFGGQGWTESDFGPIWIPSKGSTVALTLDNLALYREVITRHEGNELEVRGDAIYINGAPAPTYTFEMDYFWMMGDNHQNSLDSRYWGFVPEDHVVGKASFVWLSLDKNKGWFEGKIRWKSMFKNIR